MAPVSEEFLWGVASSGYQSEGGYNGPGQPQNNWSGVEATGRVMRTGQAADFWNRYEEDFAHSRAMGLNAFRLSIEWARVQPSASAVPGNPPPFDFAALDGYADRLAACRRHDLEPVVTLHHFTHPAWLGVDAWLGDRTPELFEKFVSTAVAHVNRRLIDTYAQPPLRWFVTINEPNMLIINTYLNRHFPGGGHRGMAVAVSAANHLLSAHVRAYNAIHDLFESEGWRPPLVTMNTFCSDVYWSEKMLLDLLCVRERGVQPSNLQAYFREESNRLHRALLHAKLPFHSDPFVWLGRLFHLFVNILAPKHAVAETFGYFLETMGQSKRTRVLDYIGLDYYDPFTGHLFRPPSFVDLEFRRESLRSHLMDSLSRKWWDWHALPEGLHFFCKYYAAEFQRGILIAENGMALRRKFDNSIAHPRRDRLTRSEFLKAHVAEIRRLVAENVPMLGYLHWSITDNYEWGSFTPRFGLFSVDYTNHAERLAVDHLGDRPSETYARLVAQFRAGSPELKSSPRA
ncbi:MAG TPA: family 1 glycosylhydrolase [Terrimicrobiaceae bacterium]|nr:family 1 glycosylhydrolase [Terrimicrobiaceae bacterium]